MFDKSQKQKQMKENKQISPWTFYGKEKELGNSIKLEPSAKEGVVEQTKKQTKITKSNSKNKQKIRHKQSVSESKLEPRIYHEEKTNQQSNDRSESILRSEPKVIHPKEKKQAIDSKLIKQANFPSQSLSLLIEKEKAKAFSQVNQIIVLNYVKEYMKMAQYLQSDQQQSAHQTIPSLIQAQNDSRRSDFEQKGKTEQRQTVNQEVINDHQDPQNLRIDNKEIEKEEIGQFKSYSKVKKSEEYIKYYKHLKDSPAKKNRNKQWQARLKDFLYSNDHAAHPHVSTNDIESIVMRKSLEIEEERDPLEYQSDMKLPKIKSTSFKGDKKIILTQHMKGKILMNNKNIVITQKSLDKKTINRESSYNKDEISKRLYQKRRHNSIQYHSGTSKMQQRKNTLEPTLTTNAAFDDTKMRMKREQNELQNDKVEQVAKRQIEYFTGPIREENSKMSNYEDNPEDQKPINIKSKEIHSYDTLISGNKIQKEPQYLQGNSGQLFENYEEKIKAVNEINKVKIRRMQKNTQHKQSALLSPKKKLLSMLLRYDDNVERSSQQLNKSKIVQNS